MKILLATGVRQIDDAVGKFPDSQTVWAGYREGVLVVAGTEKPDIVLLSAFLPGAEDLQPIISALRLNGARVILLAGSLEPKDPLITHAISCGVYDILYNPVTPRKIKQAIDVPATYREAMFGREEREQPTDEGKSDRTEQVGEAETPPQSLPVKEKIVRLPSFLRGEKAEPGEPSVSQPPEICEGGICLRDFQAQITPPAPKRAQTVIAVLSPFSSGKTFVAVNLAATLSVTREVALVDLDFRSQGACAWLNIRKRNLPGLLQGEAEGQRPRWSPRLQVFGAGPAWKVPAETTLDTVVSRIQADIVILDLPPDSRFWNAHEWAAQAEELADHHLLVVDPDVRHIDAVASAEAVLSDNKAAWVVNRSRPELQAHIQPLLGDYQAIYVPETPQALLSIALAKPTVALEPPLRGCFGKIAERLTGTVAKPAAKRVAQ
ncbi:hypothetical protein GTO91_15805 [Heliobacterium undosum]|uniref:Stage 0 sporulation protein A homolog n=1 Tax=Heliomicrobium undosum TaxID=121734 RepID=A0A845L3H5_9FIRM|nr:hypothetical protein [Heliomicrobium undosum]MZP31172.1 hypothetical protein [Heliomicrobium undosum]